MLRGAAAAALLALLPAQGWAPLLGPTLWGIEEGGPRRGRGMKGPGANRDPCGYTMIPDGRT